MVFFWRTSLKRMARMIGKGKTKISCMPAMMSVLRRLFQKSASAKMKRKFSQPIQGLPATPRFAANSFQAS